MSGEAGRGRRTARRMAVLLLVVVLVVVGAPASGREPPGDSSPSVVTFLPAGQHWRAVQDAVLDALPGPRPDVDAQLKTGNVLLADLTDDQRRLLATRPEVLAVAVDAPVTSPAAPDPAAAGPTSLPPVAAPAAACTGSQDTPQLEPEALGTLKVRSDDPSVPTAARLGYDGTGVTVGVVTTALDPTIEDFRRPDGRSAVVDYRSYTSGGPEGGGTALEGMGDVSSIVAQGTVVHDLATVVNPAAVTLPDGHCWIRIVGVAPGADVIAANAYDGGSLTVGAVVRAIDDAVVAGADVLSESFGSNDVPDASLRQAIVAADAAAIDAGVTVVVSSGDAGANSTIGTPAADPRVIAVGASITGRMAAQTGGQGLTRFGDGTWPSDTASVISSSGFTVGGGTVDVLAPGDAGWSACTTDPRFTQCSAVGNAAVAADVAPFSGTSQAAPFVAGVAAVVIQAYRETHDGRRPTPDQVQRILTGTAGDLGLPADVQGSGLVDAHAAVLAARRLDLPPPVDPEISTRTLVADTAQQTLSGTGPADLVTRVTNTGTDPVPLDDLTVTRDVTVSRQTFGVDFDPTTPTFVDGLLNQVMTWRRQSFTVTAGAAALNLQLAGVPTYPQIPFYGTQLVVLDPAGRPAAFASSNNGLQVQIPAPVAGEWTAVVQSPGAPLTFRGELAVERIERRLVATAQTDRAVVDPGQSATVRAVVPRPSDPGDVAATLRVAGHLAMPVILRTTVDLAGGPVTVGGLVRPQNGRGSAPAQQTVWEFDVPAGRRALTVTGTVGPPAITGLTGALVGPDGLTRSTTGSTEIAWATPVPAITQTVTAPEPGRWRYVLGFWGTQWSTPATQAPFAATIGLDTVAATADGLPVGAELTTGSQRTVTLSVANPGPAPLAVAVDARTDTRSQIDLPVLGAGPTVSLPIQTYEGGGASGSLPRVVVPPFTSRLTVSARSSIPLLLAAVAPAGSPAVLSDVGRPGGPAATTTSPSVDVPDAGRTPGPWSVWPMPPGPVLTPTPAGTATVSARVETATYDPTALDGSGRPFVTSTGPTSDNAAQIVPPGGRVTIPVTLPVRGAVGERVAGFLALTTPAQVGVGTDSLQPSDRSGDVLAVFPYEYTVAAAPDPSTTSPVSPDPSSTDQPPPVTVPGITVVPVTIAPVTLAPLTVAVTPRVSPPTTAPRQSSSAPSGALPNTGVDLLSWLTSAAVLLLAGGALVLVARRLRRPR